MYGTAAIPAARVCKDHFVARIVASGMQSIIDWLGERAGARTQDPVIKSHVLYRLSYALAPKGLTDGGPSGPVVCLSAI
ncbi:hypothetical protein BRAS3843_1870005 [Bradyrhizobium sp. STM 3843]|nr:hypothetical protein BRAS3843_1870005 [Bradyrhizobium sp. STM 3843]